MRLASALILLLSFFFLLAEAKSSQSSRKFSPQNLKKLIQEAHSKFKPLNEGKRAVYIPELAYVNQNLFSIAIVTNNSDVLVAGDSDYTFSIQSISKVFTLALALEQHGPAGILQLIGVEPTGLPFNSKLAIELHEQRSVNPLVNAGAIATVSMLTANSSAERWQMILDYYSEVSGASLELLQDVYISEMKTNFDNRDIANSLFHYKRLYSSPDEALDVYTKQCSVGVTTVQLAKMAAVLANGGVSPVTKKKVISPANVPELLALMTTAGFNTESGKWAFTAGLPSKTGVSGGIISVVPGRMGIAAFSPLLNEAGNSIRAMKAIEYISRKLGVGIFGPNPF